MRWTTEALPALLKALELASPVRCRGSKGGLAKHRLGQPSAEDRWKSPSNDPRHRQQPRRTWSSWRTRDSSTSHERSWEHTLAGVLGQQAQDDHRSSPHCVRQTTSQHPGVLTSYQGRCREGTSRRGTDTVWWFLLKGLEARYTHATNCLTRFSSLLVTWSCSSKNTMIRAVTQLHTTRHLDLALTASEITNYNALRDELRAIASAHRKWATSATGKANTSMQVDAVYKGEVGISKDPKGKVETAKVEQARAMRVEMLERRE